MPKFEQGLKFVRCPCGEKHWIFAIEWIGTTVIEALDQPKPQGTELTEAPSYTTKAAAKARLKQLVGNYSAETLARVAVQIAASGLPEN